MLNLVVQIGCPVSSVSQGKALAKRLPMMMSLLLLAQTDTTMQTATHTLYSLEAARATSFKTINVKQASMGA